MWAVVTTGNGGYDKLEYKQVPKPKALSGEVVVQVLAAGCNNTEINTRNGWYSKTVQTGSDQLQDTQAKEAEQKEDGGYGRPTPFPFIQGTDCCGRIVELGEGASPDLFGKRALIRSCMPTLSDDWMGSDFDGAFAQFVAVPATEVFVVSDSCDWSDAELASLPCAYGTCESMLIKVGLKEGEHVLVPGASGGVGSATVQLAKCRGAIVTAITSADKAEKVKALGADVVLTRGKENWSDIEKSIDVVVDNVGGPDFPRLLESLKPHGRYVTSGAVAGPIVSLDLRDLYLKSLTLIGSTAWIEPNFPNLISYVERKKLKPLIEATYPLEKIKDAQEKFLQRRHIGKIVLEVSQEPPAKKARSE